MFNQTTEYALRAVAHLAAGDDQPATTARLAADTQVPAGYLAKVLNDLARNGIVRSRRGPSGGFCLARKATDLTVLEVIDAVSPIQRIHACPLGLPEHVSLCPLHQLLDDALADAEAAFASVTIGELVESADDGRALCDKAARCRETKRRRRT
ncbi:MAG: RrF2 family transcriptional regulator [Planctomycetota bacterium]|jgi:Rrf2 family protein